MLKWRILSNGSCIEGAGSYTHPTSAGPIEINGTEHSVTLPFIANIKVQVPTEDPKRAHIVFVTIARDFTLMESTGAIVLNLPDGIRLGVSRDWPKYGPAKMADNHCVVAEWDGADLTGNATVVSRERSVEMSQEGGYIIYDNWDQFEADFTQQRIENSHNDSSDIYETIAANNAADRYPE